MALNASESKSLEHLALNGLNPHSVLCVVQHLAQCSVKTTSTITLTMQNTEIPDVVVPLGSENLLMNSSVECRSFTVWSVSVQLPTAAESEDVEPRSV